MNNAITILGIDVGSVAVGVAVIERDGSILHTGYRFHHGEVSATIRQLLDEAALTQIDIVAITGSTPAGVRSARRYDSEICTITAAKRLHPAIRGLLKVGGEKFSLSTFDHDGHYLGSRTNTSCAAGTGSFLDQQAVRLHLGSSEQLSEIAAQSFSRCPKIATRCAVFAKTDLIHAQQEGYSLGEISNGLCQGLAKNIVDTLFVEDTVSAGEVIFCGGVARNGAVAAHIETLTGIHFVRPALGHLYGALGACFMALDELISLDLPIAASQHFSIDELLLAESIGQKEYYYPPLTLNLSTYPDFTSIEQYLDRSEGEPTVEVDIHRTMNSNTNLDVYLGIDVGSTSTKAVLMDGSHEVVAGLYTRTAGRPLAAVQALFRAIDTIQREKKVEFSVIQCGSTGSGRKFIGTLIGADNIIDEITAHARAACQFNPEVDTIIEIGGQDAKFTTLQDGRVTSSTMNSVCAAGTGSFIEEQAAKLGCAVEDYSSRAENQRAPMVSDRCTVFMERDINHYLSLGYTVDEVLAAALHGVRENYLQKVACEKHIGKTVFFQGATAKNKALVAAFEQRLGRPIIVSKFCHLTGALGVALILRDEGKNTTDFKGFSLYRQKVEIRGEICEICTNHCKISVADVGGTEVAYGFLCGRDYGTKSYVSANTGSFQLLHERRRVCHFHRKTEEGEIRIGLPAAVHMVEDLPMWQFFFDQLGLVTVTSEGCRDGQVQGKKLTRAEFCAPITAMHGHVAWLLDRADYIFLPTFLEEKAKDVRRQYCYYTQFLPALTASMAGDIEHRILRPIVRYLYTSFHTKIELYRMMKDIVPNRWNFFDVAQAYDKALQFKKEGKGQMVRLMAERRAGGSDVQVVFVGRPYSVLSPGLNGNVPTIFNKLGIDTFYQDMLSYKRDEVAHIQPLLDEIHWEHGVRILEAAEVIAQRDMLYPVFLTSFMCTPDAFVIDYFKKVMDSHNKPYLILQLDEHDSSVGYETRIEAAVRSFRNHHRKKRRWLDVDYTTINPRLDPELNRKYLIFPNWDAITCGLLAATLRREGYKVVLMEESHRIIREGLRHNSGQCLPLNIVAQGYIETMRCHDLNPADCSLWLNHATISCNIRLYPHHIKTIITEQGFGEAGVYVGKLSFAEISFRAAANAYFAYMLGGMLRRVACRIRPYERKNGETDRVLAEGVALLSAAFAEGREKEDALRFIVSRFGAIARTVTRRPKVAIFGDLYVRDNRVMNQDLVRFIEIHGGEVITTPYSEYAKMIAPSYFRKWFNEGKYLDLLAYRALLSTMSRMEKTYMRIFAPVLGGEVFSYDDDPVQVLSEYNIQPENTGESMDNILKIHYIKKHFPDVSLFVQTSPSLCCPSLVTEAMRDRIEKKTGVPVVSVTYDGTGGSKNEVILPYLKYPRNETRKGGETGQEIHGAARREGPPAIESVPGNRQWKQTLLSSVPVDENWVWPHR
ncbi:acyl-CoA dehydratase activase [Desulfopila aestuarii]|uniref:CoA-substrate-specific enzyme activase, putative n=1 Tax=Desulfopila aestuarii DSM 18488 TaxID=1121416 RepID=A0A1M7Y2S3_9BACT|nr:acyl-CoA dehydratase activase [Desulfopila aestuarii]SHO46324.1 CoA-substrate-specific enzyme activase, putative [Desulfopila aestuarii DSM 18488]